MKTLLSFVTVLLGLNTTLVHADETLELTQRRLEVQTHETILVRTPESPATVKITYPSFKPRKVCVETDIGQETSQHPSCGTETVVTRHCENEASCTETYSYPAAVCSHPVSYCVREETRYAAKKSTLTIQFRKPRKIRGQKEFYVLRTPTHGGDSTPIRLERMNTVQAETFTANQRRKIRVLGGETPRGAVER